ncbi:Carbonic anhydrase or acetyltransferase, isoleucine patch superfamily [Flexibacter flexilis DSM 6793]|uniref:Carbonic anhydrase or acetyltransferase, isoleucine patch superfamily n=1 Tax=Flexibacter flexilis DSM 6793 TaxID=927664 RepID=A0A1I1LMF2_9BACT|nr:gamma carbonic anhydrase family protein [Flexibacter flexilis]SFC73742.1 Carbonic anhydrase or acetyltransferase, isoleucine patch superfamily [Flexibacter flexilis DSM 6793]
MALIKSVKGVKPQFGKDCFLADNATVVGDVQMGDQCSVWFNAVVRGDVHSIRIGDRTNIQDGAVIHCTYQKAATIIGSNVSIAHNAIVHGCTIDDNVLIGMGAIVMDNAHVQSGAIVAAGAVVLQNTVVERGWIYAGAPAQKVKPVSSEMAEVFPRTANNYIMYAKWFEEGENLSQEDLIRP